MWYFSWILGVLLAVAFGVINAMWLETSGHLEKLQDNDDE
jgi:cyd operon protein YbgT